MSAKLEWFGGDKDAFNVYQLFVFLLHKWDDLVDKDKEVSEQDINEAFLTCLVYLPTNPAYQRIARDIMPMWISVVSAYQTANQFEKAKDEHGIEIAHTLRYAAGHIIAYLVRSCVGPEKAAEYLPEIWKTVVFERFDEYRKEHLNAD